MALLWVPSIVRARAKAKADARRASEPERACGQPTYGQRRQAGERLPTGWITRRLVPSLREHLMYWVLGFLLICWIATAALMMRAERGAEGANITSFGEGLWWGIVTFLTVGYGDRYPVTTGGRMLASLLMFSGVVSVGIVTAKISSYFLEQALRKERGLLDSRTLKDHFVVCGWKEDMHELLGHILDCNPGLSAEQVVMVAQIRHEVADAIRAQPRLKKLQVVFGDYFSEINLRRAAPERARKILILADRAPSPTGQPASATEVDARTVMTAMTLSHIARGTPVAAEIIDPKMDHYLKLAHVAEIIYSREYSRFLLGNASAGTGVSNIIFDLLDPHNRTVIATLPMSDAHVGRAYAEIKPEFEAQNPGAVLIGVLENTGNLHSIREQALRQAQQTPDMERLVQNLRAVKGLRYNHPVFNPEPGYRIPPGSMAIAIRTRRQEEMDHVGATA